MASWYSEHYKKKNKKREEDEGFLGDPSKLLPTASALTFLRDEEFPRIRKRDVLKSKEYFIASIVGLFAFVIIKILTTQSLSFWSWPLSFAVGIIVLLIMVWILER